MTNGTYAVLSMLPGGGFRVLDVADQDKAQALADELNTKHDTDRYVTREVQERVCEF
jgi:hypothetical protein